MDEQAVLHKISVDANVNIELLKDLLLNDKFMGLIRARKTVDAILLLRAIQPTVGLSEAKMVVDGFSKELM